MTSGGNNFSAFPENQLIKLPLRAVERHCITVPPCPDIIWGPKKYSPSTTPLVGFRAFVLDCCDFSFQCLCNQLLYHCEHGVVGLMGLKPNPLDLSSFSALTWLVGSFDP